MNCRACGATNGEGANFCSSCGAALAAADVGSHVALAGSSANLREYGRPRPASYTPQHLHDEVLTSRFALEGERKQVTVLFADLVGSTELAARVGADAMHTVLDRLFEAAAAAVHRYEGTINQFLGDGFMALFGAPIAHEDHARRAMHAALDLQAGLSSAEVWAGGTLLTGLPVRIGLNTGMVVVGAIGDNQRMDYTAIGDTTNLAARVMSLSGAGQVLATDTTARLAGPAFEWTDHATRQVKGFKDAVHVQLAAGRRASASAPMNDAWAQTRFVGRDRELELLRERCAALAGGTGGVVSIVGEPGLGKSRLLGELHSRVAAGAPSDPWSGLWLEGRSLSFGESLGYWPFQDMLRRWLGVAEEDPAEEVVSRLREAVAEVAPDEAEQIEPYLLVLLGLPVPEDLDERVRYLDNQGSGAAVFRAVRALVDRLAARGPVILCFEDVHWADPASVELIQHLMPLVRTRPLLLLGAARPEQYSPVASLRGLALEQFADCFTEVRLRPLSDDQGLELLHDLVGGDDLTALRHRIVERAEGNPFYAEELVRALVAEGRLVRDPRTGAWRVHGHGHVAIPDSVQAAISARIDRLDDEVKQVLKMAAVIGRTFLYRVLEALADPDADLADDVRHLMFVELIRQRRDDPELEFAFTHALVQEAAYDSVLVDARRRLHLQVAESVELLFHDRLDEFAGILAHHYAAAEQWDKAQEHLFRAADNASRVAADSVALAQYQQAVDAYGRAFGDRWDPLQRARLERKVADALFRLGQHGRAIEHAQEASRLLGVSYPATRGGIRRAILWQALVQLWHVIRPRRWRRTPDEHTTAVLTERCALADLLGWMDFFLDPERWVLDVLLSLNNAERNGNPADIVNGAVGAAIVLDTVGLTRWGRRYAGRATRIAERIDDPRSVAYALMGEAQRASYEGRVADTTSTTARAAEAYRRIGDIRKASACAGMGIQIARLTGNFPLAQDRGPVLYNDGLDTNDSLLVAWGGQALGFIGSSVGNVEEARTHLESSLATYRTIPSWNSVSEVLGDLAVCDLRDGQLDDALARLDEAERHIKAHGLRGHSVAYPVLRRGQAWLRKLETADVEERGLALRTARSAVTDARRLARAAPIAKPWALQLTGSLAWLKGDERRALKAWDKALAVATDLEVPYGAALTLLDRGRFTGSADDLERAAQLFDYCLMSMDAADARSALEHIEPTRGAA